MKSKDQMLLEEAYNNVASRLLAEGKKETIEYLQKNGANQDVITLFTKQDKTGKLIFSTDQAIILFKWLKYNPISLNNVEKDYTDFKKYFPNKNLNDFENYIDFSEQVHAKVGKKEFEDRNKGVGVINVHGEDKENVVADDENVLILKGDDEHKCVRYGKGYSFCISRPYGGNMYGTYRLSKASTFYFVYFKKVPKNDPNHIMVLDRTKDGWEWTFGQNITEKIRGGWNEVVNRFPVLAKYENKFVNKPLTKEESRYQEKLADFVSNPTKEKFDTFSYKEKADVLKFGMDLPEDLFNSLDEFLRNEYISVGPSIEQSFYNKLTDSEKQRFTKVRKNILDQQEPQTIFDLNLIKEDPKLYEKYIKLEEKDYKEFLLNYENVKNVQVAIDFKFKYIPLNLPDLRTCGNIEANKAKEIHLPNLQACGSIEAEEARELNLPQLQKSSYIDAPHARKVTIPKKLVGNLSVPAACEIIHPEEDVKLESFKNIFRRSLSKHSNCF